jgi:hypothetical protein
MQEYNFMFSIALEWRLLIVFENFTASIVDLMVANMVE